MRFRTGLAIVAVIGILLGATVVGFEGLFDSGGELTVRWTSDTARPNMNGNHHAPAAARVGDHGMIFAPISGAGGSTCALLALNASNGSTVWSDPVAPANCTIHSVADPTVADYDADGLGEVLAATTEEAVLAYEPHTGTQEFRQNLSDYGYTQPVVADLTGDDTKEVIAVDVQGTISVFRPDGTTVWTNRLASYTWGQPAVADFDSDGANELVVGLGGGGNLTVYEGDGRRRWKRAAPFDSSITWMTTGQADGDPAIEIAVGTTGGVVAVVDGASGDSEWRRDVGDLAAVRALGDGDGDGAPELYATAKDGALRSLDASNGTIEWETTLTSADVGMMPPPSMADLDGDGESEIVAATNDGLVSVLNPNSGEILATYERAGEVPIYVHPTVGDTDRDGTAEIYVMYGDGRVVALAYHSQG
ncbi:hypothetical protein BRC86_13415 [Halobacteriales archaeon QS_3_64_16]|nr:MAG: hypothetical protein BRC86_13415 [Halobacteriales archaeon QS_3_64_16]